MGYENFRHSRQSLEVSTACAVWMISLLAAQSDKIDGAGYFLTLFTVSSAVLFRDMARDRNEYESVDSDRAHYVGFNSVQTNINFIALVSTVWVFCKGAGPLGELLAPVLLLNRVKAACWHSYELSANETKSAAASRKEMMVSGVLGVLGVVACGMQSAAESVSPVLSAAL